jgi:aminoglycoside phosphotransferase family enzyme/predicted kinase
MDTDPHLIAFLLDPESYPEKPQSIVHHETHISHVFVGQTMVYKIKKPVDFGFLDFTTKQRRRFFCAEEVRLNSRLAEGIYLGVVPIYGKGEGYSFRKARGRVIVEYAVRMLRIPEERLLSRIIEEGKLAYGGLDEVGSMLARFHGRAMAHRHDPFGTVEAIRTNTEENFAQVLPHRGVTVDQDTYERLVSYTRAFIDDRGEAFSRRKESGFVREGHGDLHSGHVCLIDPPIIMDCIEFNKRFRIADVLEDMAFLFMDMEYRGRFDLSASVSRAYFSHTVRQQAAPELITFYKVYRAIVRGKIEGFTAGTVRDEAERRAAVRRGREYFLLARYYAEQPQTAFNPVVFMGVSGSGKSAIAEGLLAGSLVLRSDLVRKEMAGVEPHEHLYVGYGAQIYGDDMTQRTYLAITQAAVDSARRGQRVVVDATFLARSQRAGFYEACLGAGLNPFFIHCFADGSVLRERVRLRTAQGTDISDAHISVLEQQLRTSDEPDELPSFRVFRLNTGEETVETIRKALRMFL